MDLLRRAAARERVGEQENGTDTTADVKLGHPVTAGPRPEGLVPVEDLDRVLDAEAVARIVAAIDRETAAEREWTFVMISPAQNALVVDQIMQRTVRPALTVRLWAKLFLHLRMDTGEIVASREELAAEVSTQARHISTAMGELEDMGALIRRKEGRHSRWFMNPRVGTHLAGAARDKAQASAPALRLVEPQ